MAAEDDRERLRTVAFQNAQSVLIARRRAEQELQKQSEWLRNTLASIGDAVLTTDTDSRIMFLNGVGEMLTGWSMAEATGRPLPEVFQIMDRQTREPLEDPCLRALREGAAVVNHAIMIPRDGTERTIDVSAAPIRNEDGQAIGVVLVFRDVTEQERGEQAQAFLAAIVESSEDAIVSKTLDGVIRSWNTAAERLFGYSAEEAVGRPISLIIPPERLDEEQEILGRIRSGERLEHFETVRVSKQGRRIEISLTVSPIRDSMGSIIGASKIAHDITERKRAEQALREADRCKGEFIAILAHELRNPLAPLRTALQVMRLAGDDLDATTRTRELMERQIAHMVRLIDDLLDVSRLNRNKMELRRSWVTLTDAIRSAVEVVDPLIKEAGLELILLLPEVPIHLDADLTRLAQILGNLLTNAAKYTERGGKIWVAAERQGSDVVVSVRDSGIGIPADALPNVFDMFAQVDGSVERAAGGLGIGLALVKGLVEMHGGTVSADSPGLGKGSVFRVRLPALWDPPLLVTESPPQPHASAPARRILVVDDNRDSATALAMLLGLMGNVVRIAHDGFEALDVAETFRPEVILMDVGMPRLDGYEATRRLRKQPWSKAMAIIAVTGWGQERDKLRAREAGCNGHLVKPVGLSELQELLLTLKDRDRSVS